METKQTGTIHAFSDDGREFVIQEYSAFERGEDVPGTSPSPSVVLYQTEESIPVNRVGGDLFEVLTDPEPTLVRPRDDG